MPNKNGDTDWMTVISIYSGRCILAICALIIAFSAGADESLRINQLQFVGSHNSYKMAMNPEFLAALRAQNPQAAASLEYEHIALDAQLDLGIRKLELDVFYDPQEPNFVVGHVQQIDMNSHCTTLLLCLQQVRAWSDRHPRHVPIWLSFNAKDQPIVGLPKPYSFDVEAFAQLDRLLEAALGDRLIRPREVLREGAPPLWPTVSDARGRFLLVLDEGGEKRDLYWQARNWQALESMGKDANLHSSAWRQRPMFINAPAEHPAAAIMIMNDPIGLQQEIGEMVDAGYLVRTRADADTVEARSGDTDRRDAAFASGAQAISTDYYLPAKFPGATPAYQVVPRIVCNPCNARDHKPPPCTISE